MLLTVWMYAYLRGVLSTRAVEDRCRYDATFRVACGRAIPDHTTFSRFRKHLFAQDGVAEDLFCRVLHACACAGLGRLSVVAGDGVKVAASASKEASRAEAGLRKMAVQVIADAAADDRLMPGGYACQDTGDVLQAQELARVAEKGAAVVADAHAADPALLRACHGRLCTLPAKDKNSPDHDAAACHHAMTSQIGVLVQDAGYYSQANLTAPGPDRLIADGKTSDLACRQAVGRGPAAPPPPRPTRTGWPPPRAAPPTSAARPTSRACTPA